MRDILQNIARCVIFMDCTKNEHQNGAILSVLTIFASDISTIRFNKGGVRVMSSARFVLQVETLVTTACVAVKLHLVYFLA